jgi:hypothetical protein
MVLPFGKLERRSAPTHWTRAQALSAWQADLERAGCEVEREAGGGLDVLMPGWDSALFSGLSARGPSGPEGEAAAWVGRCQRWFWDRMRISVSDAGEARFSLAYLSAPQLLLHALVTAFFALDAWTGSFASRDPASFLAAFAASHAAMALVALAGFRLSLAAALKRARDE